MHRAKMCINGSLKVKYDESKPSAHIYFLFLRILEEDHWEPFIQWSLTWKILTYLIPKSWPQGPLLSIWRSSSHFLCSVDGMRMILIEFSWRYKAFEVIFDFKSFLILSHFSFQQANCDFKILLTSMCFFKMLLQKVIFKLQTISLKWKPSAKSNYHARCWDWHLARYVEAPGLNTTCFERRV